MINDASINHTHYLLQALDNAKIRRGFCAPNPSVGAVIVSETGDILSTGYHLAPGLPHAEIDALTKLKNIPANSTMYVTLEPCCHYGKTPPCTDALTKSGIKRVIYAYKDPNPIIAGRGEANLRASGIDCEHFFLHEIDEFYKSYAYWHETKKPFVTAKLAMTLNGMIAGKNSEPIKITDSEINLLTHQYRKSHDAILTTTKTIIADNPQLNSRLDNEVFAKPLYILDSKLELPLNANVFSTAKTITVFYLKNSVPQNIQQFEARGVRCIGVDENKGLSLEQIVRIIGEDGIHDLWIEAGGTCFGEFLRRQLLNRGLIYVAPHWVDEGKVAFSPGFQFDLQSEQIKWRQIGKDVLCEINW